MKDSLGNRLGWLRDAVTRNRQEKEMRRDRNAAALSTVESVVDSTDSKIRLVPGYQKRLQSIVQSSIEFADDLVKQIPGAIEVSSRTFASDPHVNAFFTNVTDLQSIFSHSSELRDYLEDTRDDNARCCALLCMHRSEKMVLGMELSGDILKKDVMQTAISFSDHRIYSPAPSEPEAREGLKNCLFHGLVTNALERITQHRLSSHRLQSRHQMLHSRLRHYKNKISEVEQGTQASVELAHDIQETAREIRRLEKNMLDNPLLTPQVMLDQVADVLSKPEEFVRARKFSLRLNKMGIVINEDSPEPANQLNLTEVIIGKELPRVVTLAVFPKKELDCSALTPAHQWAHA